MIKAGPGAAELYFHLNKTCNSPQFRLKCNVSDGGSRMREGEEGGGGLIETCKHNLVSFIHFPVLVNSSIITGGGRGGRRRQAGGRRLARKCEVLVNLS